MSHKPPSVSQGSLEMAVAARMSRPARHRHIAGIEEHFKAARETDYGYLKPSKRLMADLFVSKDQVLQAIEFANQLFVALNAAGHQVGFSASQGLHARPDLMPCKGVKHSWMSMDTWAPHRPTIAWLGSMSIGLTIYEPSELVEGRYLNGKYVRVSEIPVPKRRSSLDFADYRGTPRPFTTGRLAVRAYSPDSDVPWERHWEEPEPGDLVGMIDEIIRSLKRHAAMLAPQVKEATENRRKEAEARVVAHAAWLKDEAVRQEARRQAAEAKVRAQAIQDSRRDFFDLIQRWDEARRVQTFIREAEAAISALDPGEQADIGERLQRMQTLLGDADPVQAIRAWKAPEER